MTAATPTKLSHLAREVWSMVKTVVLACLIVIVPKTVLAQPFTIPSASMEPTLQAGDYIVVSKFAYGWSRQSVPLSSLIGPSLGAGRLMARQPHRGDVVVFKLPRDERETYIKRLIGLPGDTIQVRRGALLINGRAAPLRALGAALTSCPQSYPDRVDAARYVETLPGGKSHPIAACFDGRGGANDTAAYKVPVGCYFMMGDNRDNSLDSRFAPTGGPSSAQAQKACPFDPSLAAALGGGETGGAEAGVGFVPFDDLVGKADLILASWSPGASLLKPWTWVSVAPGRWLKVIS